MYTIRVVERWLAGLLLLLVMFFAGRAWFAHQESMRAQAQYQGAAADAGAATAYVAAYKAVQKQREEKDAQVARALDAHEEWADAPVPDDVADLLRNGQGTTRAVP